ncbi:MAG: hypothetical protein GY862_29525 [Gammaproteobacteria bacterium]|nr:hypothetical protein [Gammaproteobacteria bacterium]
MGQESLVREQIGAGQEFIRDFNDYVSIAAAFWINPDDSEDWILYVASVDINDDNFNAAYGEILRRVGTNKNQWLDAFQVKLLNSADPLAAKVIEIRDRYPLKSATCYNGSSIAGMPISGAFIYPPIAGCFY